MTQVRLVVQVQATCYNGSRLEERQLMIKDTGDHKVVMWQRQISLCNSVLVGSVITRFLFFCLYRQTGLSGELPA